MRKSTLAGIIIVLTLATAFLPVANAAPKVILYSLKLTAEPAIAGKNMPITLTASVDFGGACCYTVYSHDVMANLNLSKGLKMISGKQTQSLTSPGQADGHIAALPGGGLTKIKLQWTLISSEYGEYNASLYVKGYADRAPDPDEIFERTTTIKITVVAGACISAPMYPHPPAINTDTIILVNVTAVTGDVSKVLLNYSFDNSTWMSIPMTKTTIENDNWIGTIPKQKTEKTLYFYMFSVNTLNQTFTTPLYTTKVKDYGQITAVQYAGDTILIVGAIVGALFVAYLYIYSRNVARARKQHGLLCVGQDELVSVSDATIEINKKQKILSERRKLAMVALIILAILLIVIAVVTGQFSTIISRTTNPLGS